MRLARIGPAGAEVPAIVTVDGAIDVSSEVDDFDPGFFAGGGLALLADYARTHPPLPLRDGLRFGAPIARPGKIVCIGLNYLDHAEEAGLPAPMEPIVFLKASNTLIGPTDDVRIPRGSTKTDWEIELGVVIGRRCRYLQSDHEAAEAIVGYMVCNDLSERSLQFERGGQWDKGKSCETFNPAGPWLTSADSVDARNLDMWLNVNGQPRQRSNTSRMIFSPPTLVRYLSQVMVLEPGDLINTGTPGGVAFGPSGHPYLRSGDRIELGITGLGGQRLVCVDAP